MKSGKTVVDMTGGIGVLNHGHNHERIVEARMRFALESLSRRSQMRVNKPKSALPLVTTMIF